MAQALSSVQLLTMVLRTFEEAKFMTKKGAEVFMDTFIVATTSRMCAVLNLAGTTGI